MELVNCKCGNPVLVQVHPTTIWNVDFRVWSIGETITAATKSIPVFMCLSCNRYILPSTNMSGKNRLDPEVQVYEKLVEAVDKHNETIDRIEKLPVFAKTVDELFGKLELRCIALEKLVEDLREDICNMNSKDVQESVKEEEVGSKQTGKRSRKSSKSTS